MTQNSGPSVCQHILHRLHTHMHFVSAALMLHMCQTCPLLCQTLLAVSARLNASASPAAQAL